MSDVTATGWEEREDARRPRIVRTVFWVAVGGWLGSILALAALSAPAVLGVATAQPYDNGAMSWFSLETTGGAVANVAMLATIVWGCTWGVRGIFRAGGGALPASTWTALTLAPAALAVIASVASTTGAGIVAALALRFTAFRADGTPRPEPLDALDRRVRNVLRVAIPVLAIGIATAYAVYHPLAIGAGGTGERLTPGRSTATVWMPRIHNDGGRPVRILAIEPGVERGYALRLTGVRRERPGVTRPGEDWTAPFAPFTLAPHDYAPRLLLQVSRAGCTPGQSGRIESVRVRYRLGGERTMLLALDEPLTLSC